MATAPGNTEEENLLAHVYKKSNDWESIGRGISERNKEACDQRTLELDTVHKPSYPWTSNENRVFAALSDSKISLAVCPFYLPDRTHKACIKKRDSQRTFGTRDGPNRGFDTAQWTALEAQKLVEQKKANKSWKEISEALNGRHSYVECRTHWFNHFWEEFNNSFVNGNFDIERYKEMRYKEIIKTGGGIEAHDDEVDAVGDTDYEEDSPHEGASGIAALAPEQPPNMPK